MLERLWLASEGRPREFYKGLIQAAVAVYHWSRGNRNGALSLFRTSSQYLRKYRPAYLGVDVETFLQHYTDLFGWLRRHRMGYEPGVVPIIRWLISYQIPVGGGHGVRDRRATSASPRAH